RRAADGGHGALIAVFEGFNGLAGQFGLDELAGMFAALNGRLRQLRQGVIGVDAHVADGEDMLKAAHPEMLVDFNTPAFALRNTPLLNYVMSGDTRGPHDEPGLQELLLPVAVDNHAVLTDLFDRRVQAQVHIALNERFASIFA